MLHRISVDEVEHHAGRRNDSLLLVSHDNVYREAVRGELHGLSLDSLLQILRGEVAGLRLLRKMHNIYIRIPGKVLIDQSDGNLHLGRGLVNGTMIVRIDDADVKHTGQLQLIHGDSELLRGRFDVVVIHCVAGLELRDKQFRLGHRNAGILAVHDLDIVG